MTHHNIDFSSFQDVIFVDEAQLAFVHGLFLKDCAIAFDYTLVKQEKTLDLDFSHCPLSQKPLEKNMEFAYRSGIFFDRCHDSNMVIISYENLHKLKEYYENLDTYDDDIRKLAPKFIQAMSEANDFHDKTKEELGFLGRFYN